MWLALVAKQAGRNPLNRANGFVEGLLSSWLEAMVEALCAEVDGAFAHEAGSLKASELEERVLVTNALLRTGWSVLCARIRELEALGER